MAEIWNISHSLMLWMLIIQLLACLGELWSPYEVGWGLLCRSRSVRVDIWKLCHGTGSGPSMLPGPPLCKHILLASATAGRGEGYGWGQVGTAILWNHEPNQCFLLWSFLWNIWLKLWETGGYQFSSEWWASEDRLPYDLYNKQILAFTFPGNLHFSSLENHI